MSKHIPKGLIFTPAGDIYSIEYERNIAQADPDFGNLLSAAPDMHEALKEIYGWTVHKNTLWAIKAEQALAKAEGKG